MRSSPERSLVAVAIGLFALACIGLAGAARWPAGRPFPPLAYKVVDPGTASLAFGLLGLTGLATAGLVGRGARLGWWLMLAGIAWDGACQVAGLSTGQAGAAALLGVDAVLAIYVFARSALFET